MQKKNYSSNSSNNQDAKQKRSRVFYVFCFISQGIVNDCVSATSILHPVELTEQSVAVILATDNPSSRCVKEGEGPETKRKKSVRLPHCLQQ